MFEEPILEFNVPGAKIEPVEELPCRTKAQADWQAKANYCQARTGQHDWLPISYTITANSKHATVLMCKACYHTINIAEMYAHR